MSVLPFPTTSALSGELASSYTFYTVKTDMEGCYTYVNAFFAERFSFLLSSETEQTFIGKPSLNSIDVRDHAVCLQTVGHCIENPHQVFPVKLRKPSPSGGSFWTQWEFSIVVDEQGQPKELLCIGYDISDQENQLQALIENSPDVIFVVDRLGQLEEFFMPDFDGFVQPSMATGNMPEGIPDMKNPFFENALSQTLDQGKLTNIEYTLERNGSTHWFLATAVRFFYRKKNCVLWIARDISNLKRTQQEAILYAQRLDHILESITDAFISLDKQWHFTKINQRFIQLVNQARPAGITTELTEATLLGRNFWEVIIPCIDIPFAYNSPAADAIPPNMLEQMLHEAMNQRLSLESEQYFFASAEWYQLSVYPSQEGLTVFLKDITMRKNTEFRVRRQNERLRQIALLQSHQVRAPLASILGLASLIEREKLDDDNAQFVDMLTDCARQLDQIIGQIVAQASQVNNEALEPSVLDTPPASA